MAHTDGIFLKKRFGQHFLRDTTATDAMIARVSLHNMPVLEIGCGDGFLTRAIAAQSEVTRIQVFEIDPEWAELVRTSISDKRLTVDTVDVLKADFTQLNPYAPWVLLANLPYQVTFPILHRLQEHRHLFKEGVIMVQEEVAQKIVKKEGRGYGYSALFFQRYFSWELLQKVPASAFLPPPKVTSRLLYFKPHAQIEPILDEEKFWQFIRICFHQPRRTLKNNLAVSVYNTKKVPAEFEGLRAQQMSMQDLLQLWDAVQR